MNFLIEMIDFILQTILFSCTIGRNGNSVFVTLNYFLNEQFVQCGVIVFSLC